MSDTFVSIQACITGFEGEPATVLAAYHLETRVLTIARELPFTPQKIKDSVIITNDPSIDYDEFFSEDKLKDAIESYFYLLKSRGDNGISERLVFSKKAIQCNPEFCIAKGMMTDNGQKYVVGSATNFAVGALACCLYAVHANDIDASLDAFEEINKVMRESDANRLIAGEIITF